jgi:hypothetical protein
MKYFSSSESMSLTGEFRRFRDPAKYPKPKGRELANAIRNDLMDILRSSQVPGFGLGVILKDYRAVQKSARARRILNSNPYEQAYLMMMIIIAGSCEDHMPGLAATETVAYLCDEHDRSANVAGIYDTLKQSNPTCAKWMGSLGYMDNKKSPALQAADLLAGICKQALITYIQKPSEVEEIRDDVVRQVGAKVGISYLDKRVLRAIVDANLLKDGKPSIYSTRQLGIFEDMFRSK